MSTAFAVNEEQQRLYRIGINRYDLEVACQTVENSANGASNLAPGNGAPNGAKFPSLPPLAMAKAIDKYIEETKPNSKMSGLGQTIVAGAQNSDVSPFLIVAIAQQESSLSDPNDFNVRRGSNSFGRTATTSQPNFQGSRLWYKWDSVKASVDHTNPKNKNANGGGDIAAYIRNVYADSLDKDDLVGLFLRYAPPGDNNDTQGYINSVKGRIDKMVGLANESGGTTTSTSASTSDLTTAASGGPVYMLGDSITLGAKQDLTTAFREAGRLNHYINASVSRSITAPGTTNGFKTSGIEAIDTDKDKPELAEARDIVIALGTNPNNNFESTAKTLIGKIRQANSDARLHWVNIFSTGGNTRADEYNPILNRLSTSLPENQRFNLISTQNSGIELSDDDIHPTSAGNAVLAEAVVGALPAQEEAESTEANSGNCSCGDGSSAGSGGSGGSAENISGTTYGHKAYNFFTSVHGLSPKASAAIVGNLMLESGGNTENIDPEITNSIGAHGIAQWLGNRKVKLFERGGQGNFAKQLEYIWFELTEESAGVSFKGQHAFEGGSKNLIDILKESNDIEYMTIAFEKIFERSGVLGARVQNAIRIYEKYGSGGASSSGEFVATSNCSDGTNPEATGNTNGNFIWPLTKEFAVSSCFGQRDGRLHTGIDIAAPRGTPIVAADGGIVEYAEDRGDGFGNSVMIKHSNGKWTLYAHLNTIDAKKGARVNQGQNIGTVNNTGSSRGDHLHFNIQTSGRAGQSPEDPLKYLSRDGRGVSGTNCPASLG